MRRSYTAGNMIYLSFLIKTRVFSKLRVYILIDKKRKKMLDPDARLMLEFKNGDISSFEKLLQKYKDGQIK